MCVPNSPQWFNTGLYESYGITGKPQGHYYVDPADGELKKSTNAYERPQPHACFILSVDDDLVNEGGIMDPVSYTHLDVYKRQIMLLPTILLKRFMKSPNRKWPMWLG